MADHRVKHLGRDNHGLGVPLRLSQDPLLHDGEAFDLRLGRQIAPVDHHGVGGDDDLAQPVQPEFVFDLRHDADRTAFQQLAHLGHVLRALDERYPHEVDALRLRKLQHPAVSIGEHRAIELHVGNVEPLGAAQDPIVLDAAHDVSSTHIDDLKLQGPVVRQHDIPGTQVEMKVAIGDRNPSVGNPVGLRGEHQGLASLQRHVAGEQPRSNLPPRDVEKDRDERRDRAHSSNHPSMPRERIVRTVEPYDVQPLGDQLPYLRLRAGRGSQRRYDFRLAVHSFVLTP